MLVNASKKSQKIPMNYCCQNCDYNTSNKKDYNKHLLTDKHKNAEMLVNASKKSQKIPIFFHCDCGKIYKHETSYYRHKKVCENAPKILGNDECKITDEKIILMLINQCKELKDENKELIEIIKNGIHNVNISNNVNNSNNKSFNINFFLNETCKDAMNIMDFIDSIKLQLSDLEGLGKLGYVEGISNIIVKNLKEMDVHKRPVHCSDSKREVMYIKDDNKWEKENENNLKLRKLIKHVAHKNTRLLPQYKEKYPECDTVFSEQYNKLIIEAMGGLGDNDKEKEDKIIHRIAKEVTIDKINL